MNRFASLFAFFLLGACAATPVTLSNPLTGAAITVDPQGYAERRARVELVVKSRYDEVLADVVVGGGPALTAAFDAAAVPEDERPARIRQMQGDLGIYQTNIDALILQLLLYGV